MNITVKKLAELHKPAHNIRRHSDKQITEYIRSIEMFGQVKPLVVAEDGEIIAGNGLYEALLPHGSGNLRLLCDGRADRCAEEKADDGRQQGL